MKISVWALVLLSVVSLVSCSDTKLLKPKEKSTNIASVGTFCTQPPDKTNVYTKFLFVIDKSGSNVSGNGGPPTDPDNVKRADNIEKFWSERKDNQGIKWGYIVFQDTGIGTSEGTRALIKDGEENPIFSGDPNDMVEAISKQRSESDNGGTPYAAAISLAKTAIRNDKDKNPNEDSNYIVFFMSDGYPTDRYSDQDVKDLINISPGRIYLSSAYYGPPDGNAEEVLRKMSEVGQGKYINLNTTSDFGIDDLIHSGPTGETYVIKPGSFVVYNVNSAICMDNSMGMDSDGDGLCDKDEISLGKPYDPKNRFSFGDAYSDYIHYAAFLAHDVLTPCQDRGDIDNDLLTVCEEAYMKNMNPTGTKLTSADRLNPDTDGDGVIDGIEYFMLRLKSVALDQFNLFKNYDSEFFNAGDQIRAHRNPLFPDDKIPVTEYYDTKIDFTGYSPQGQSCYNFSQNNLQVYKTSAVDDSNVLNSQLAHPANGNVILVSFIETLQRDPSSPGVYVYSFQTLDATNSGKGTLGGLTINDKVFKLYKVPVTP